MKRVIVVYNYTGENAYANIVADRMEYTNTHIYVFNGEELVGIFKISNVIDAHISIVKENGK